MTPSPAIVNITPSFSPAGPLFNNVAGTLTPPVGVNNTIGWVEFGSAPLTAISITYDRTPGYWAFFDSLTYDCCVDCGCNNKKNAIKGETSISSSGGAVAKVNINSAGVPIKKLNVSIPFYQSLAGRSCIQCVTDPTAVSRYGKIQNLPAIAGVTPTFTGNTTGIVGSAEIVYEFPTPIVLDNTIELKLQFPPTNPKCKNLVKYCVKLDLIDADCKICEQLLCVAPRTIIQPGPILRSKAFQDGAVLKMLVTPNPVADILNVTLPMETDGVLEILDVNGKSIQNRNVSSTNVELNVKHLKQGTYLLQYTNGDQVLTERFIKQ